MAVESLKVKVENTLYATMDSTVAKLIIEGRLRDEKRKVSVLFSDLAGFTSYSEKLNPELVIRDLNQYLGNMEPILLNFHGHIDKYLGDGIMCEFGAPLDYKNYQLMAVITALKMQEKMVELNYPWKMRIGIASGSAIMGVVGSKRQSYTTIGDVVNLASRLETASPPGSVLIDSLTLEGVSRFVEVRLKNDLACSELLGDEIKEEFEQLHKQLDQHSEPYDNRAETCYKLGKLHMTIMEASTAANCFESALRIDPENADYKMAFAEASLKKEEFEKIKVKGREQKVSAYEVLCLKDPLLDRDKLTDSFYEKYSKARDIIAKLPENEMLKVEVLDASIGHSKVVAVLAYAMAAELGVATENARKTIVEAAYFADVGKEIISHYLLNRSPGALSAGEFAELQKHPLESARIIRKMGYEEEEILAMVRHSHENYNGSGYPDGLCGEDIPLGARIITVADTYDTLTSWRPYQECWDRQAAFNELQHGVDKGIFDAKVVEALLNMLGYT